MSDDLTSGSNDQSLSAGSTPPVLYKYVTIETARAILSTGKLRFQTPLRYNDPLDSQWDPFWEVNSQHVRDLIKKRAIEVLTGQSSIPDGCIGKIREKWVEQLRALNSIESTTDREAEIERLTAHEYKLPRPRLSAKLLNMRRRLRFCCFSKNPCQPVMWSHYAAEHRGVVLGFDSLSIVDPTHGRLAQIRYVQQFPEILEPARFTEFLLFGIGSPDAQAHFEVAHLTKALEWKYEEEWRALCKADHSMLGDLDDVPFSPSALRELIFGLRTDGSRAKELAALAVGLNVDVQIQQAVVMESRFGVELREVLASTFLRP